GGDGGRAELPRRGDPGEPEVLGVDQRRAVGQVDAGRDQEDRLAQHSAEERGGGGQPVAGPVGGGEPVEEHGDVAVGHHEVGAVPLLSGRVLHTGADVGGADVRQRREL